MYCWLVIVLLAIFINNTAFSIRISLTNLSELPIKLVALQDDLIVQTDGEESVRDDLILELNYCEEKDIFNGTCTVQKTVCSYSVRLKTTLFPCACFRLAGIYTLNKINGTFLMEDQIWLDVRWPHFQLTTPTNHIVFDGSLTLQIKRPSSQLCLEEEGAASITSRLRILRLVRNSYTMNADDDGGKEFYSVVIDSTSHGLFSRNSDNEHVHEFVIGCDVVDRSGQYAFQLVITIDKHEYVISDSGYTLRVEWDTRYQIQTPQEPVFPCDGQGHFVAFWRPNCPLDTDRIRLYAIEMVPGATVTSPTQLLYIAERRIHPHTTTVRFGCSSFQTIYRGYCFKYVSVLRDGLVVDHNTQCLPTLHKIQPTDGGWSDWQDWSTCSSTCDSGLQVRLRYCDSPAPLHGGSFCNGDGVQRRQCRIQPCSNGTDMAEDAQFRCSCGCIIDDLSKREGIVVVYGKLCPNTSVWTVRAGVHDLINVTISSYHLMTSDNLKIRDGRTTYDRLLFDSDLTGFRDSTSLIKSFISSRNTVYIEFTSLPTSDSDGDNDVMNNLWNGAVLRYTFIDGRQLLPLPSYMQPSFWYWIVGALIVTLFGILLCYLLLIYTKRHLHVKCQKLLSAESSMHSSQCESAKCKLRSPNKPTGERLSQRISLDISPKSNPRHSLLCKQMMRQSLNENDMSTSVNTQSTRISTISNDKQHHSPPDKSLTSAGVTASNIIPQRYISRRSIGIQLSSPALTQKRPTLGSLVSVGTCSRNGTSSPPISLSGTENDFEYDYYEAHVPGSFLSPLWNVPMQSDIDIDEIIGNSDLMLTPKSTPTPLQSNSTQISPTDLLSYPRSLPVAAGANPPQQQQQPLLYKFKI